MSSALDDVRQLASFAPVVIGEPPLEAASTVADVGSAVPTGLMEIFCPTGYKVVVGSDVDRAALRLVLDVLAR